MSEEFLRQQKVKGAFLKTIDKSIDSIGNSVLKECFGEELFGILGNEISSDFIASYGLAKGEMEKIFDKNYKSVKNLSSDTDTKSPVNVDELSDPELQLLRVVLDTCTNEDLDLNKTIAKVEREYREKEIALQIVENHVKSDVAALEEEEGRMKESSLLIKSAH